jgi:hypothetical protein
MSEKSRLTSLRITCSQIIRASVLTFLLVPHPYAASQSENILLHSDPAWSDNLEFVYKSTNASDTASLEPEWWNITSMIGASKPPIGIVKQRGVDWRKVFSQSALFLAVEQGFRLGTQPGTREALKGKFFDDWFKSVKSTKGWGDGDDFLTNYIGHPMEGAVVANIFVQNDPRGRNQVFSRNSAYWNSRLKATVWSAIYSTQFELGPISEASLGNVGNNGNSLSGAVDLVVTPLAGLGWQVGEDAIDKYLIVKIESWTSNPVTLMFARSVLNPTRSFANVMRMMVPWSRDTRPGIWRNRRSNR